MSAILRAPQIVPSLFSPGQDRDDARPETSAARRMASRFAACSSRELRDGLSATHHHVPVLMAYSGLLAFIGKPLFRVAALAIGAGAPH